PCAADSPKLEGRHYSRSTRGDAAAVAKGAREPRVVGIADIIKENLLPRARKRIGHHELPVVGERQCGGLLELRKGNGLAVVFHALGNEIPFIVLEIRIAND